MAATKTTKPKTVTAQVTVTKFTDASRPFTILRDRVPVKAFGDVKITRPVDYDALGYNTPLRDAVARLISHGDKLRTRGTVNILMLADESGSMRSHDGSREQAVVDGINDFVAGMADVNEVDPESSGKVLAVILSDGFENASREISTEALQDLIAKREADGWTFIFIGAQIDAWNQGTSLGLSGSASGQMVSSSGSSRGVQAAMASVSTDASAFLSSNAGYAQSRNTSARRSISEEGAESLENSNAAPAAPSPPPAGVEAFSSQLSVEDALKKAKEVTS